MQASNRSPHRQVAQAKTWLYGAAALSVIAGLIHIAFVPEHFAEWVGYGLFFLVAGVAQLLYAYIVLSPNVNYSWLVAGIVGNSLIIGLYLITRTLGIPFFGPEAGEVESVGWPDALSKVAEAALIVCLFMALRIFNKEQNL